MYERDMVGAQLIRRNDELSLVYEKMKIVGTTLDKGEREYKERLEDIRILKLEIRSLRCKINALEKNIKETNDLRLASL